MINKGLRSEINQLKIKCSNRGEGCGWVGELGQLKKHLESEKGCGFVIVGCPNKCQPGYATVRKELAVHLKSECVLRPYQCKYCGHKDTYQGITGTTIRSSGDGDVVTVGDSHYSGCPAYPLTCPNKCGATGVKRKDMDDHRSKCPLEQVECPFAETGCGGMTCRRQFDEHLATSQQQHLLLMLGAYKEVKSNLQGTEAKLKETEANLQAKLKETETKLAVAEARLLEMEAKLKAVEAKVTTAATQSTQAISGGSPYLKKCGDSIVITIPNVTQHFHGGKPWHSPPFYVGEGYKMCFVVAKGVDIGGHTIQFSVSIQLLQGEHDDKLKWPLVLHEGRCSPQRIPPPPGYIRMCGLINQFQTTNDISWVTAKPVNNRLVFNIKWPHNYCYLMIGLKK